MNKKFLWICLFPLLLNACSLAPKYVRPNYGLDSLSFRFAQNSDTVTIADTAWNKMFKDSVLCEMIQTGLANNFNLLMTYEKVKQANYDYKIAKGGFWPSVSISGVIEKERTVSAFTGQMTTGDLSLAALGSLSWELDIFGKVRSNTMSEKAQLLSSVAGLQALKISLIAEIANNYFSLLQAHEALSITHNNLKTLEESLALVSLQLEVGTVTGVTVAQAKAELASTQMQIPSLEESIGLYENNLRLLLGMLPSSITSYGKLNSQLQLDTLPSTGIPSRLLERRPDIIQAEQNLIAANAQIGVAKANLFPSLSLTASGGYYKIGKGWGWDLLGSLVQPVFEGGKLRNTYKQTKSARLEMLYNYQSVIYSAMTEVSNAILSYQKSLEQLQANQLFLNESKIEFDLSNQLYEYGMASYLDVLTAQRSYFSAQITYSEAKVTVLQNYVTLYKSLGGGW